MKGEVWSLIHLHSQATLPESMRMVISMRPQALSELAGWQLGRGQPDLGQKEARALSPGPSWVRDRWVYCE